MKNKSETAARKVRSSLILGFLLLAISSAANVTDPAVDVITSNSSEIKLRFRVQDLRWDEMAVDDRIYQTPFVPGCGTLSETGAPQLPVRQIWLAIPPDAQAVISSVQPYSVKHFDAVPAPVEAIVEQPGNTVGYEYNADPVYYSAATPWPAEWVRLEGPQVYRDLTVVRLIMQPFRFPDGSGGTTGLDSIDVRIALSGGSKGSGAFPRTLEDEFYEGFISNWSGAAKSWKAPKVRQTDVEDSWPEGDLYKIKVGESGIYRLTYNYLNNAGVDVENLDPQRIRMYNNGGQVLPQNLISPRDQGPTEIAILVHGEEDGSFDPGDEIWFYGKSVHEWEPSWDAKTFRYRWEHYQNPYTDENVYWLNIGVNGSPGKRMPGLGVDGSYTLNPTSTFAYYYDEKETYALYDDFNLPRYMPELYGELFSGSLTSRSFNVNLADVVDYGESSLIVSFIYDDLENHQFAVYVNNELVDYTLNRKYSLQDTIVIPEGTLHSGNNTIRLEHLFDGLAYLDYLELEYPRSLTVTTDDIVFLNPASDGLCRYQINGLDDPWIFNITDYADVSAIQADGFTDSSMALASRRYYALQSAALKTPQSITKDSRSADEYLHLRSTLGADVLVVCADQFYSAMADYEEYRELEAPVPMEVIRVKISDIYDEYGWGLPDPVAIRDFLKSTLPPYSWAVSPLYVLFVGDGDWDYKNNLSNSDVNWLIPYVDGVRCTDDWYSYFTPTDDSYSFPQLATGRWPVRSIAEVEHMIERVKQYEGNPIYGPWRDRVIFVADDEYAQGGIASPFERSHTIDTETITENYIPSVLNVNKIYMTEYPVSYDPAGGGRRKPEANADLMSGINEGCLLVNYMGHGNPTVWAHEHVFLQSRDLPLLTNGYMLPLFIAATCDWAYWDSPFSQSMPEIMATMQVDGAIAAIAASRVTGATANKNFLENFYPELFAIPGSRRLGVALMRAKIDAFVHNSGGGSTNYNAEKYHLLGDPVIRLAMPEMQVAIDMATVDTLTALDEVVVSGEVQNPDGIKLSNFDGIANFQVFDTRIPTYYEFGTSTPSSTTYMLPGNLIFRGDVSVENGEFESEFIVPVDISYGGVGGRFSVYAYTDELDAGGANDEVVFSETAIALQDSIPPNLNIYFESPAFRAGDAVSSEATMYVEVADSNGINLTGSVGHGITVSIDGQNPIDLTDSFSYYLNSHTVGRATYKFMPGQVSAGMHTAHAIAWDAANNPSSSEMTFEVIGGSEGLRVYDVLNYPNPLERTTKFTFCLTEPADVSIKIYTVAGRLIKVISGIPGNASFNYNQPDLVWNGNDEQGDPVSNGVYLYKVIARSGSGSKGEATGRLVVMR